MQGEMQHVADGDESATANDRPVAGINAALSPLGGPPTPAGVLALQRAAGNAATARLLARQRVPEPGGGRAAPARMLQRLRSRTPFEPVIEKHHELVKKVRNAATYLSGITDIVYSGGIFRTVQAEMFTPVIARLRDLEEWLEGSADSVEAVVDAWVGGSGDGRTVLATWLVFGRNYDLAAKAGAANPTGIQALSNDIDAYMGLIEIVSLRVGTMLNTIDKDAPDFIRDEYRRLAAIYAGLIVDYYGGPRYQAEVAQRLTFLNAFYGPPGVVEAYALRHRIAFELPSLYGNLVQAASGAQGIMFKPNISSGDTSFDVNAVGALMTDWRERNRVMGTAIVFNMLLELLHEAEAVGTVLPTQLNEVKVVPRPDDSAQLATKLFHAKARLAILTLWRPLEWLRGLLMSINTAGVTLNPTVKEQLRDKWLNELNVLPQEFTDEFNSPTHSDIDKKIDGWEHRVQTMLDDIPPEVRRATIVAEIASQIPFMFVAGATVARVGMWVRLFTASRWLIALAEGLTMTALTAVGLPPGAPGRPKTALGWVETAALNVFWARIGRLLFDVAGDSAGRIAMTRYALIGMGARVVVPGVTLATLQTTAQMIEAKVHGQGGDTSFTELLTINLIMQAMGLVVGSAALPSGTEPASATGKSAALVLPSSADLAAKFGVSTDVADAMLEVAARMEEFMAGVKATSAKANAGTLTPEQFKAQKQAALDLADWLEPRLIKLAKANVMGGATEETVKASMATLRARLQSMTYSAKPAITALLPQSVTGLSSADDDVTWTYDPASPPKELPALEESYKQRGYQVLELTSGGFAASDPKGSVALLVVPLSPAAAKSAAKPLGLIAEGPLAQAGLARVRAQTAVPVNLLESELTTAAQGGNENSVKRILQHLGRFIEVNNTNAWAGLSNYLRHGGDPALLARGMAYGAPKEFAAESTDLARTLLTQAGGWDDSAVRGFGALYRLKPNLTAERLHSLLGDFTPEQVTGILQSLDVLEGRSHGLAAVLGPLTSGSVRSQRGAMGALTSGVQLASRFPSARLRFEAPVTDESGDIIRVTDISVIEQETTTVAGVTKTVEHEVGAFEIKEVSTAALGKRAPQELARDIVRDWRVRSSKPVVPGGSRPFFETFRWRIRRIDLEQKAMSKLGLSDPKDPQVEAEMRRMIRGQLEKAFDRPEMSALPADETEGYRRAFAAGPPGGLPFVEFF